MLAKNAGNVVGAMTEAQIATIVELVAKQPAIEAQLEVAKRELAEIKAHPERYRIEARVAQMRKLDPKLADKDDAYLIAKIAGSRDENDQYGGAGIVPRKRCPTTASTRPQRPWSCRTSRRSRRVRRSRYRPDRDARPADGAARGAIPE